MATKSSPAVPREERADIKSWIAELIPFIHTYNWIYDVQVTHLFKCKIWEKFPKEWYDFFLMLSMEELSSLPTWTTNNHSSPKSCPESLKQYITTCDRLSIGREPDGSFTQGEGNVWKENTRGMNPKKLHEVSRMAGYVSAICKETNCGTVVDVGSGLGYLGQCLSSQYNLRVVGLEREEERVSSASRRSRKIAEYHSPIKVGEILERGHLCVDEVGPKVVKGGTRFEDLHADLKQMDSLIGTHSPGVKDHPIACNEVCFDFKTDQDCLQGYCHSNGPHLEDAFVTLPLSINDSEASLRHFQTVLEEVISKDNDRVCLTGLHCCGDLTPTIMRWYSLRNTPQIKAVVLVGCCYHKMAATDGQEGKFKNFPMSQCVTEHVIKNGLSVSKYALRLAAQETKRRWLTQSAADHMSHMKRVAYRAILEVGLHRASVNVPLTKVTRVKESSLRSFSIYLDEILKGLDLSKCQTDSLSVKENLMKTYEELSPHMHIVEAFSVSESTQALQVCLQGPLESLVLLDRLLFMKECGVTMETLEQDNTTHAHVKLVPLFDDYVSPRSIALVMA